MALRSVGQKFTKKFAKVCQNFSAKVDQKICKSAPKMFEKVRQKTIWQKCAKNVCKSVPKELLCKSAPKMFAKVCQSVVKVPQNCLQKLAKMFEKVGQKNCLAKVRQKCLKKCAKLLQKCAKSVAKVCQKCLKKCKKRTVWRKCTRIFLQMCAKIFEKLEFFRIYFLL